MIQLISAGRTTLDLKTTESTASTFQSGYAKKQTVSLKTSCVNSGKHNKPATQNINKDKAMSNEFNIIEPVSNWDEHDTKRAVLLETLSKGEEKFKNRNLKAAAERFCVSPDLQNAINAAIVTRTPLLLTGEAGTGKTQVAWFLARYFNVELFEYQVHSNSQAKDMRYDFDAVAYLRDAYLAKHQAESDLSDSRSSEKYLQKGALWKAYEQQAPSVLLIDEIDKAPRDFPNDLLQELDQNRFAHPFIQGECIQCKVPPIIILTSNGERRLPDAFLRRCMVHQIKLDGELLKNILVAQSEQFPELNEETQQAALAIFNKLRNFSLSKKPGTAELLLWLSVLSAKGVTAEQLNNKSALPPALSCLIKDNDDYQLVTDRFDNDNE
ncbi:MoxR family ATPase [Leucothrix sargassi]|nr:MoxR family ATPase [Leucothrix sargassi]